MNNKQVILTFFFLLFAFAEEKSFSSEYLIYSEHQNYAKIFGSDYQSALNFMKVNKKYINKVFDNESTDKKIIISFLFPERIRYSILRDYLETEITESIYVNYGSEYVDFSIGYFQMKPSFIEKLEQIISDKENLSKQFETIISYKIVENQEIRKQRVARLQSFEWQLKYAKAFYTIICSEFDLSTLTEIEKVKFLASAYNSDFSSTQEIITKNIEYEAFPYGNNYPLKQYSYAKVAAFFYESNYNLIF